MAILPAFEQLTTYQSPSEEALAIRSRIEETLAIRSRKPTLNRRGEETGIDVLI